MEDQYAVMTDDIEPSSDYDLDDYSLTSSVSVTVETKLRLLGREGSRNFYRQKPVKCHIVRRADSVVNQKNPNNIVYMSRFLHQQLDSIY